MKAINSFTYFNGLDEGARREGCLVAKIKAFDPNEIIMGDGAGVPNFVYFVLSGNCQMIESLKISYSTVRGRKYYSLYDPYVPVKTEDVIDFETKYFKNRILRPPLDKKPTPQTPAGEDEDHKPITHNETDTTDKEILKEEDEDIEIDKNEKESEENQNDDSSSESSLDSLIIEQKETNEPHAKENNAQDISDNVHKEVQDPKESGELLPKSDSDLPHDSPKTKSDSKNDSRDSTNERKLSVAIRIDTPEQPQKEPPNLRTYFMQVCIFKPGSTFGFGENMQDRRIVAMTRVDCMLLPKMWLLQRNTANIWSRVQRYLEKKIPTKKKLFKEFVQNRSWLEWRDFIVEDIARKSKTVNHTTYHDVPYSIRMQETPDI